MLALIYATFVINSACYAKARQHTLGRLNFTGTRATTKSPPFSRV
jgi:hypothetical protein